MSNQEIEGPDAEASPIQSGKWLSLGFNGSPPLNFATPNDVAATPLQPIVSLRNPSKDFRVIL